MKLGIGDWGLGIGDWGPKPKTPVILPKSVELYAVISFNNFWFKSFFSNCINI